MMSNKMAQQMEKMDTNPISINIRQIHTEKKTGKNTQTNLTYKLSHKTVL